MTVIPISKVPAMPPGSNMDGVHANRFHVWVDGDTVRITFGDTIDGEYTRWFGSACLPRRIGKDLVKTLADLIKQTEQAK